MKFEINPCHHCGAKGVLKGRKHHRVVCSGCGAQGPTAKTPSKAVELWNREKGDDHEVMLPVR